MRTFIAINLDDTCRERIGLALKPFYAISSPLKWVRPENMHITLRFLGELDSNKLNRVLETFSELPLTSVNHPILRFSSFGYFGKEEQIRTLWVSIEKHTNLNQVSEVVQDRLERIGFERETVQFVPHLTVARSKKRFNFKPYFHLMKKTENQLICELKVTSIFIMKSALRPGGPEYSIIKEIKLD